MNKVIISGRLTRDPEIRETTKGSVADFSVAVKRKFKDADGNYGADFVPCAAFGKTAEFVGKYFKKGSAIVVSGRYTTSNYVNKDGVKVYKTNVSVDDVEFGEGNSNNGASSAQSRVGTDKDGFMSLPEGEDEDMPF